MTRYATKEEQYFCGKCDKWITEREMIKSGSFGLSCPGCEKTAWTNENSVEAYMVYNEYWKTRG